MELQSLSQVLLVGAGGFVGSVLRYGLSGLCYRLIPFAAFPYGTLAVNVLGCLAIGLLQGAAESRHVLGANLRLFLFIGVLGGFTTFSSFGYETIALMQRGEHLKAAGNVLLTVALCLACVFVGHAIGRAR